MNRGRRRAIISVGKIVIKTKSQFNPAEVVIIQKNVGKLNYISKNFKNLN